MWLSRSGLVWCGRCHCRMAEGRGQSRCFQQLCVEVMEPVPLGPVSLFRVSVSLVGTGVRAALGCAGPCWPDRPASALSIGLGITGAVPARPGGHLFARPAGPHGRRPLGRPLSVRPALLGLSSTGRGRAWALRPTGGESGLRGRDCSGSSWASSFASLAPRAGEGGWGLRVLWGSCPSPSSEHPALLA